MNPAGQSEHISETNPLPVARIVAQEIEYVLPLREYLEMNGCMVLVNESTENFVTYTIVAGDYQFVKRILALEENSLSKRLGIVIGSSIYNSENLADSKTKIVVSDPVHLTGEDVLAIMLYFFTGKEAVFDKRRKVHEPFDALQLAQGKPAPNAFQPKASEQVDAPVSERIEQDILSTHVSNQNIFTKSNEDEERIGSIISDVFKEDAKPPRKPRRRKFKTQTWVIAVSLFIVFIIPYIWYFFTLSISGISYALVGTKMKSGDAKNATKILNVGNYWHAQSALGFQLVRAPFALFNGSDVWRGQERLLSFLSDVSGAYQDVEKIFSLEKDVASLLLMTHKDDSSTPAPVIGKLKTSVTSVQGRLGLAQAQLANLLRDDTFPFVVPQIHAYALRAQATIESLRGILTYVDNVLTLYPHIAGFREPKTYLVLLQNSNELRPTGGFIGSVGVAKFEEGYMVDFSIQDVYALDGQLKGHVDPPIPIRDILGSEHWYLRDSNWDPDFKVSAERALWFYEKETGSQADGVIAVNVPVVTDILQATGPIVLSDYNDRITAENFFGKSFYYTQNNFFPGSTQKRDFLGSLTRALMNKITTDKDVNTVALFRAFASGIARRDIMFMFRDETLERLVDHYGWSGRLFHDSGCSGVPADNCLFDPFIAAEANLSVSKINYFVKRTSVREVTITPDGSITESVAITLKNTVNQAQDPNARGIGGSYIPYIRFIVPAQTNFQDVSLDNIPMPNKPKTKDPPKGPYKEISTSSEGTQAIGVVFEVPPGAERQVRVTYKHTRVLPFGKGGAYLDLMSYKHPGISDNEAKTVIRYPVYWVASDENSKLAPSDYLANDGQLEYNTTILHDWFIRLKFIK